MRNAPGTIDADYRGEIGVVPVNLGDAPFTVTRGLRIAQLVVAPVARIAWDDSDALPGTARGPGGFGSTGVAATFLRSPKRASRRRVGAKEA